MKRLSFFLVLVLVSIRLDAQQSLLIFFEATEKKPFYVKLGSKTTASSSTGQVYLTDLPEKNYELMVGFPNEQIAEQQFAVTLSRYDNSFQLKEIPGGGWTLINLETGKVISASAQVQPQLAALKGVRKTDAFSIMMAGVVNDTAVLYTSVASAPPPVSAPPTQTPVSNSPSLAVKPETPGSRSANSGNGLTSTDTSTAAATSAAKDLSAKKNDSLVDAGLVANPKKTDSPVVEAAPPPVAVKAAVDTVVARRSEMAANQPQQNNGNVDTALSVVASKTEPAQGNAPDSLGSVKPQSAGNTGSASIMKIKELKKDQELMLSYTDITGGKTDTINIIIPVEAKADNSAAKKDSVKPKWSANPRPLTEPSSTSAEASKPGESPKSSPVMVNSDCVNFATEYDVDKLRVRMVNETSADDRVLAARKVFRTKCFTSRQIRALTELFINDEGKYKFLDAAYPFVSDSEGFRKLVEVLSEDYYVKRFNAMIRL